MKYCANNYNKRCCLHDWDDNTRMLNAWRKRIGAKRENTLFACSEGKKTFETSQSGRITKQIIAVLLSAEEQTHVLSFEAISNLLKLEVSLGRVNGTKKM